jgi:hypothetical protein
MAHRRTRRRNRRDRFWIQRAVKRPGRVKRYMKRRYGKKAFTKTGEIKMSYLRRAAKETKNRSLRSALLLAIRLKRMRR